MTINYRCNDIVEGIVSHIVSYGAFVYVDVNISGLIHISEISYAFIEDIHQYLSVGQRVYCRIIEIDETKHQLKLSLKGISKKVNPRNQRRARINLKKKELLPAHTIGFNSLKQQLSKWIELEKENEI